MKILVTGHGGFIGRSVQKILDFRKIKWERFEGNVLRLTDFKRYGDCDVIIHLAGISRCDATPSAIKNMVKLNIQGTLNALHFAAEGNRKLLFASSYLYGNTPELPIKESALTCYFDEYSYSKWYAEQSIFAWNKMYGVKSVIFRIFNVYGPGQPGGFLVSDIMSQIPSGCLKLRELTSRRDFIYLDDLSELIVRGALQRIDGVLVINSASGKSYSVGEIVNTIFNLLGCSIPVEDENIHVRIKDTIADIVLAKNILGWQPMIEIKEGLRRVLEAYKIDGIEI